MSFWEFLDMNIHWLSLGWLVSLLTVRSIAHGYFRQSIEVARLRCAEAHAELETMRIEAQLPAPEASAPKASLPASAAPVVDPTSNDE